MTLRICGSADLRMVAPLSSCLRIPSFRGSGRAPPQLLSPAAQPGCLAAPARLEFGVQEHADGARLSVLQKTNLCLQ